MIRFRPAVLVLLTLVFGLLLPQDLLAAGGGHDTGGAQFPPSLESYNDTQLPILQKLMNRITASPFNLVGTLIFFCAIVHTFLSSRFMQISHKLHDEFEELAHLEDHEEKGIVAKRKRDRLQIRATFFHFLGEVEAVFGIWLIPLGIALFLMVGLDNLYSYIDHVNFTEPIFVVVIMTIASSRPVLMFAEKALSLVAGIGKGSATAWWLSILTIGPLLGSFITEPAAMTICALLLADRFYRLNPSMRLRYATIGLLFVNISIGGVLTHFAAPPVVMVASTWNWDLSYMFTHFGWRAVIGLVISNIVYYLVFRKELALLRADAVSAAIDQRAVPAWLVVVHIAFIAWTVFVAHHAALVVLTFLFFLAFVQATERNQDLIRLRSPLLVGFFLASLVIHGGFQAWWIAPVLSSLSELPLMVGATILTAFNDNAAITYLASLVPDLSEELKYAVVAGAVTGGGLTVIANAPNPAGQSILQKYFGDGGVNPLNLLFAAIVPTIIMGFAFMIGT